MERERHKCNRLHCRGHRQDDFLRFVRYAPDLDIEPDGGACKSPWMPLGIQRRLSQCVDDELRAGDRDASSSPICCETALE